MPDNKPRALTNAELVVLTLSAEGDGTVNSNDQDNASAKGVVLFVDISALANAGGSPTFDAKLQAKDPGSGSYFDLPGCSITQLTGVSNTMLMVHPGIASEVANSKVALPVPRTWRVVVTLADGDWTATIAVCYVL